MRPSKTHPASEGSQVPFHTKVLQKGLYGAEGLRVPEVKLAQLRGACVRAILPKASATQIHDVAFSVLAAVHVEVDPAAYVDAKRFAKLYRLWHLQLQGQGLPRHHHERGCLPTKCARSPSGSLQPQGLATPFLGVRHRRAHDHVGPSPGMGHAD